LPVGKKVCLRIYEDTKLLLRLNKMTERVITTDLSAARDLIREIIREVEAAGYDKDDCFAIRLATEEALINAIKHGNKFDRSRKIRVSTDIDSQRVEITIADEGEGFDPASVPDPTADENLEKPCGRGIMLMRAYMDEVIYNDKGNEVRMIRNRFSGLPKIRKTSANILERKDD